MIFVYIGSQTTGIPINKSTALLLSNRVSGAVFRDSIKTNLDLQPAFTLKKKKQNRYPCQMESDQKNNQISLAGDQIRQ